VLAPDASAVAVGRTLTLPMERQDQLFAEADLARGPGGHRSGLSAAR